MAHDDEEDLYDEEFDFVDDDDVDEEDDDASDVESEAAETTSDERNEDDLDNRRDAEEGEEGEEPLDEYGRPEQPATNYVVHVYENRKFHRTIDRPFTPEDAEAFASEFNRTSKNYSRFAITSKNDAKPKKTLEEK